MEATVLCSGYIYIGDYWDNGKENGSYYIILGLYLYKGLLG